MEGEDSDRGEHFEIIDKQFREDPNDDRPIGRGLGKNGFSIPEYADGEKPPELAAPKNPRRDNSLPTKDKPIISKPDQQKTKEI